MENSGFFQTPNELARYLAHLRESRRKNLIKNTKRQSLSTQEREVILSKTEGRCHICGIKIEGNNFEADHIKSHSSGGEHKVDNYLASCSTCNNYRWHYSPEEIHWILKLGVWTKTNIQRETKLGTQMATAFINYDIKREQRRKVPRTINKQ